MQNCQSLIDIQSSTLCSLPPLEFCLTIINAKPVLFYSSNVEQEMEFQIGSTLQVNACQIASLSQTSRAKHCAVFYLLNSISLLSIQIQFYFVLQMCNRKWNFRLVVHSQQNHAKLPVSYIYPELNIVQSIYLMNSTLLLLMQTLTF